MNLNSMTAGGFLGRVAVVLAALLIGCAGYSGRDLVAGKSTTAEVQTSMGAPAEKLALPGGESDARNTEAARELILELFRIWDELDARRALPEELYVLELGVGNGNQARKERVDWKADLADLDEFGHHLSPVFCATCP